MYVTMNSSLTLKVLASFTYTPCLLGKFAQPNLMSLLIVLIIELKLITKLVAISKPFLCNHYSNFVYDVYQKAEIRI